MRSALLTVVTTLAITSCARARDPNSPDSPPFRDRITLIGAHTADNLLTPLIQTIAPDGTGLRTVRRLAHAGIDVGRVAPDGRRLVFSEPTTDKDKAIKLWLLGPIGEPQLLAERAGAVTAWSPDGKHVAFVRPADTSTDEAPAWESFTIDVSTKAQRRLPLPADCLADDWHPRDDVRTVLHLNPRNWIFRAEQRDRYPLRQLELQKADGTKSPITKDRSFDNLDGRFSPTGDRLAYYRRRFVDGRAREFGVVSALDGSWSKETVAFTDMGDAENLHKCRPQGSPCWSPDGKTVAWLVRSYKDPQQSLPTKIELVLIPADGGKSTRLSLTEKGLLWVTGIDWR
jgi:Tol biopolymer transport system component